MSKVFYIMGKSASGKDSIYARLLEQSGLCLKPLVIYTTRPIRAGEQDGVEYHFTDEMHLKEYQDAGKVIELRMYQTVFGPWYYFTVDDGSFSADDARDTLAIGTLESYQKMREYLGSDTVVPLYIEVADDLRLERAIARERRQMTPNYSELCRRFLADTQDFSEDKLREAGIEKRFANDGEFESCLEEAAAWIRQHKE